MAKHEKRQVNSVIVCIVPHFYVLSRPLLALDVVLSAPHRLPPSPHARAATVTSFVSCTASPKRACCSSSSPPSPPDSTPCSGIAGPPPLHATRYRCDYRNRTTSPCHTCRMSSDGTLLTDTGDTAMRATNVRRERWAAFKCAS